MAAQTGRCLCGSVRFRAEDVRERFTACHCSMCRRWGGGPLLSTHVREVSFEGVQHIERYRSSKWAERGFCRTCGTHLFYFLTPKSDYYMPIGVFDDAQAFTFTQEIFIDRKPDHYSFAEHRERLTEAQSLAELPQD